MKKVKETDFMSELDAATALKPATPAILMLFTIIALIIFFIVWAGISKVEERTRGQGQVVPTSEVQYVQSLEGGILAELLVNEGDLVQKGDPLLKISDVQFSSEGRGTEARFLGLSMKKSRLQAEAEGKAFNLPNKMKAENPEMAANERALYLSRQQELKNAYQILDDRIAKANADLAETRAQVNRLSESKRLLNKELSMTRDMVAKRAVPQIEQIRLERELADIGGQINAAVQKQKSLAAEAQVTKTERQAQDDKFRSQALSELNKVETDIAALEGDLTSISDRVDRAELRAPVTGIVNNISVKTIGGVIEPAQRLVEIVPVDDELKIIAKIAPADIAFIHNGQPAKVKITAYDPQKYGSLNGRLVRIGANSVNGREGEVFFEVEIKTDKNHLGTPDNPLPITPGMVADIEIITGKRSILEYLLKPVLRARDNAFTER